MDPLIEPDDAFMSALNELLTNETGPAPKPVISSPAPRFELQHVSHTHEAIMNFMIARPDLPLRDVAHHFGYTQAWLSTLIHSDLFQARLREKQDIVFAAVAQDIPAKLAALADISLEKLTAKVEESEDPRFILESTKTALASLGFGNKGGAANGTVNAQNVQQNFYVASPADLEVARGRITGGAAPVSTAQMPGPAPVLATPNTNASS